MKYIVNFLFHILLLIILIIRYILAVIWHFEINPKISYGEAQYLPDDSKFSDEFKYHINTTIEFFKLKEKQL